MSLADVSTVDLTRTRLRLNEDVTFTPHVYGEETCYHIDHAARSSFFRIGYVEYVFISLLDGRTTFAEALALTSRRCGAEALGQTQALSLYSWLLENRLAQIADDAARGTQATEQKNSAAWLQQLNPFWIRLPLGQPDEFLKTISPALQWLFSPAATLATILLIIAAAVQLAADWSAFSAASSGVFARDNWLWLLLAWLGLKGCHELAHGLVCRRYGGRVTETGLILAFFAPLAYVDATSSWSFTSRWKRIHVAAAGMYVELLLASVAVFLWTRVESTVVSSLLYNVIIMASVSTLLFNANPLMKFDGYYILSDLLQQPNLYTQSGEAVQQLAARWIWGRNSSAPVTRGRHRGVLLSYGLAAVVWRLFICCSMLIAASVLFHGAGVALVAAGVVAWFGVPVLKFGRLLVQLAQQQPSRLIRGAVVCSLVAGVTAGALLGLPGPFQTVAPGVVQLQDGRQVRAEVDGFVEAIHVVAGQQVAAGDVLLTLRNEDVRNQVEDLKLQIKQEEIRQQTAMQDLRSGDAAVAVSKQRSLHQQLRQAERRLAGLTVRAPAAGAVVARNLSSLLATFVEEGDELLLVDDGQSRRLRISVAEEDIGVLNKAAKERMTLAVRLGTRPLTWGVLERIVPRASRTLPAESLAATEGGALPVRSRGEESESELELTEHRFVADLRLPAGQRLPLGERGYATLGDRDESLGQHLYRVGHEWFEDQLQLARDSSGD
ncbi:MAG: efflux RND transporter periplasmic adaptor subunit [Planctomycetaceae bacterium]|nr:efflux RND transporter periplasmic adaptor subunit [Planctomycetaceae bacterium]